MATAPLFHADIATLRTRLRLTGVPAGTDAVELILEGVLRARLMFYRALGTARVAALVALAYNDTPTTNDQIMRAVANSLEVKITYLHLLDTMPTMFMDGGGNSQELWNEEAPFRQGPVSEKMKARLRAEIEADLNILTGDVVLGEETTWQVTTNEPDEAPPEPGDTTYAQSSLFGVPADEGD